MPKIYRPRHPERTAPYRVLFHHFDRFLTVYESRISCPAPFRAAGSHVLDSRPRPGYSLFMRGRIASVLAAGDFMPNAKRKFLSRNVLKLKEGEKPKIKDNEVLVRVHASSVNAGDLFTVRNPILTIRVEKD